MKLKATQKGPFDSLEVSEMLEQARSHPTINSNATVTRVNWEPFQNTLETINAEWNTILNRKILNLRTFLNLK